MSVISMKQLLEAGVHFGLGRENLQCNKKYHFFENSRCHIAACNSWNCIYACSDGHLGVRI